jgi:hypothetical protein
MGTEGSARTGSTAARGPSKEMEVRALMEGKSAAHTWHGKGHMSVRSLLLAIVLSFVGCALFATQSSAAVVTERPFLFSFDGSSTPSGAFEQAYSIAVDNATGAVYVGEGTAQMPEQRYVHRFHADGSPWPFAATGSPSVGFESNFLGVAVDNSGGSSQGRLIVSSYGDQQLRAYNFNGELQWAQSEYPNQLEDAAVDSSGHPWGSGSVETYEFASSGSPPPVISALEVAGFKVDLDSSGNLYTVRRNAGFTGYEVRKYVAGSFDSVLDPDATDIYADQSSATGHLFTVRSSTFSEFESDGTEVDTFGEGYISKGTAIAYNPTLDRVYVFQGGSAPSVAVFGPAKTGTVGDATIEPPSAVGVSSAHFSGSVNPLGTESEWRFQWRQPGQSWSQAVSSPAQPLPVDSTSHSVEYTTDELRGNSQYEVRLVAVNKETGLAGASEPRAFATETAPAAPAVTIDSASAITTSSARISGTVDPEGDTADWHVETSADPQCDGAFVDRQLRSLAHSSADPVVVEYNVEGLLPAQHYCARIVAENSAGSTTSPVTEFETSDVMPAQVFTAFAAPRTDTTARLNGLVNPIGSDATYRFEYSTDGSNWAITPDGVTPKSRSQVTVSTEIAGLQPATTYRYRFLVENGAGKVEGTEKTFETRSIAEMTPRQRGIELVNPPDKGNQNAATGSLDGGFDMVRADGEKAIWSVSAGAPGGNTGTSVTFLSTRTPTGWNSQVLSPPPAQQVGGGAFAYKLTQATPDFGTFLMRALQSGALEDGPPTFVRLDDQQHQEVLKTFSRTYNGYGYESADMTTDGLHVLIPNPENGPDPTQASGQLEEVSPTQEVISIMPDGTPSECGVPGDQFYGDYSGNGAGSQWRSGYHRMAMTDASRVYFQSYPNGGPCSESKYRHLAIYYRDRDTGKTVEIDDGTARGTMPAIIRATPDGRSVYFVTATPHAAEDQNLTGDVYSWDSESSTYTCLTCVVEEADLTFNGAGWAQVLVSDDFSHVYFVSEKQLLPGYGKLGRPSLYVLRHGDLGFVASLAPTNFGGLHRAQISHDGNVLLFSDESRESGHNVSDPVASECRGTNEVKVVGCKELVRYEDSTGSLECLSCRAGGVTTNSFEALTVESRLSDDGSTVAFVTREPKLPSDINSSADIYEWHEGSLQLISDGETSYPSSGFGTPPQTYGIDADGKNILFTIVDPDLTGYEHDKVANLYDARVGGGFPRPAAAPHCSEESCQGPLQAAPPWRSPGTSQDFRPGNPKGSAKRCAGKRGKARRRCLKRSRSHRRHHHRKRGAESPGGRGVSKGGAR